jgi:hypothetical protein
MNRLTVYVKLGLISESDKRSLWYHALTYANDVKLLGPSKTDPTKTQFEEGEGVKFNFSTYVILPFGLRVVIRKKQGDQDGRGINGIYVGFSKVVAGGILVYMFGTKRVVQKYTFVPREPMPTLADIDCEYAALALYGDITSTTDEVKAENEQVTIDSSEKSKVGGAVTVDVSPDSDSPDFQEMSNVGVEVIEEEQQKTAKEEKDEEVPKAIGIKTMKKFQEKSEVVNTHHTRSKTILEKVLVVASEKPPRPKLPTRREARKSVRWKKAFTREIVKINEENTLQKLAKDTLGRFIRPDGAVVMRLISSGKLTRTVKWNVGWNVFEL